jgi:hypothetical protein
MFDEVKAIAEIAERNRLRSGAMLPLLSIADELGRMQNAHEKQVVQAAIRGPVGEAKYAKLLLELGKPTSFISAMSFYAALETAVRRQVLRA